MRWLLISFALIGVVAAAYCWWVLGVQVDAADADIAAPAAAGHGGAGLIILALSVLGLLVTAIVGHLRRSA